MRKNALVILLFAMASMPVLTFAVEKTIDPRDLIKAQGKQPLPFNEVSPAIQDKIMTQANNISSDSTPNSEENNVKTEIPQDIINKLQGKPFLFMGANYLTGGLLGIVTSNQKYISYFAEGYLENSNKKEDQEKNDLRVENGGSIISEIEKNNFDGFVEKIRDSVKMKIK